MAGIADIGFLTRPVRGYATGALVSANAPVTETSFLDLPQSSDVKLKTFDEAAFKKNYNKFKANLPKTTGTKALNSLVNTIVNPKKKLLFTLYLADQIGLPASKKFADTKVLLEDAVKNIDTQLDNLYKSTEKFKKEKINDLITFKNSMAEHVRQLSHHVAKPTLPKDRMTATEKLMKYGTNQLEVKTGGKIYPIEQTDKILSHTFKRKWVAGKGRVGEKVPHTTFHYKIKPEYKLSRTTRHRNIVPGHTLEDMQNRISQVIRENSESLKGNYTRENLQSLLSKHDSVLKKYFGTKNVDSGMMARLMTPEIKSLAPEGVSFLKKTGRWGEDYVRTWNPNFINVHGLTAWQARAPGKIDPVLKQILDDAKIGERTGELFLKYMHPKLRETVLTKGGGRKAVLEGLHEYLTKFNPGLPPVAPSLQVRNMVHKSAETKLRKLNDLVKTTKHPSKKTNILQTMAEIEDDMIELGLQSTIDGKVYGKWYSEPGAKAHRQLLPLLRSMKKETPLKHLKMTGEKKYPTPIKLRGMEEGGIASISHLTRPI